MKFATKAVHAGVIPDPTTGAIMTPIYQTSTYVQTSPGKHKGYEYARTHNPTRTALEQSIATLENGKHGFCFASGMAATDTVIKTLSPKDEVIVTDDLYGGAYRMFVKVFAKMGIKFHFVAMDDLGQVEQKINANTKMIWVETPTNPLLKVIDIAALATLSNKYRITLVVDNTFATPYIQMPLTMGAHIVIHSISKYLNGHSDSIMGAIVTNDSVLAEQFSFLQNSCGAVPGPQDCFLALRGIKTLHLRMAQHCKNGWKIAQYLDKHPKVARVYFPGLESHTSHAIAKKQMCHFGGMLSFTLKDDSMPRTMKVLTKVKLFSLAESLGGVESLIGHPASMTHASMPKEIREKAGLVDSLIRLSVGIEDVVDLIADLEQAIQQN